MESITAGGDLLSKVDPYVDLGVRERKQRTKTVWNSKNPTYDEVFNLIVDDLNTQVLTIQLHDDDMGFNDPVNCSGCMSQQRFGHPCQVFCTSVIRETGGGEE